MPLAARQKTAPTLASPAATRTQVLVVDDEPTTRILLSHRVAGSGCAVELCESAAVASRRLKEHRYDLVLLDWELGSGKSGLDLCAELRRSGLNKGAVVVMVTGRDDTASLISALEQGADDYITKPLVPSVLDIRLRVALNRVRGRQARSALLADRDELEQKLHAVVESSPDPVFIKTLDGRYALVNSAAAELFGNSMEGLLGLTDDLLFGPEDAADVRAIDARVIDTGEPQTYFRTRVYGRQRRTMLTTKFPYRDRHAQVAGVIGMSRDITQLKETEEALRRSEERFALATEGSRDGFWDWSIDERSIHFTERFEAQLGLGANQLGSDPERWLGLIHPADIERLRSTLDEVLEGRVPRLHQECRVRSVDGSHRWVLLRGKAVLDAKGKATRLAGSQTDITDERLYDPVTGLPNRALFLDRVGMALRRKGGPTDAHTVAMAVLVDGLEAVQAIDATASDRAIEVVSERFLDCGIQADAMARVGATALAVLVEAVRSVEDALQLAESMRQAMAEPVRLAKGGEVLCSLRIGILLCHSGCEPLQMLRDAHTAALRAPRQGGSEVFDATMHDRAVRRIELVAALRRSLDTSDVRLLYQPIVSLPDGRLVGVEALARWRREQRESIPPVEFIALAEESGLIVPLGFKLLREACQAMAGWRGLAGFSELTVAVNLAADQILAPTLVAEVEAALSEWGLPASALDLEVTETGFLRDIDAAVRALEAVRALGVGVSIDDFGTGYSSLSYLHRIPATKVKVDRSFVSRLGMQTQALNVTRAILAVAEGMGLSVVAEGIETAEQRQILSDLGCSQGQGYFFARPLEAKVLEALLQSSAADQRVHLPLGAPPGSGAQQACAAHAGDPGA